MPAKKNAEATGGEDTPPVETKSKPVEDRHIKLREERRAYEAELSTIDAELRQAINDGDLTAIDRFASRKAELPRLYIAASSGETAARQAIFSVEDQANLKRLRAAEDKRDELRVALVKMKERHAEELAALDAELQATITEVGATHSAIQAGRDLNASCDAGFKKAMAGITGV